MTVDPIDADDLRSLLRLQGLELLEADDLEALAAELRDLLEEGRICAGRNLGELGPYVYTPPWE